MRSALTAFLGEIRKCLLISWTYKVNTFISLFTLGFIFIGIVFFVGGGKLDPQKVASALIGYLTWMYAVSAISDLSYGLRGEISAGTLEQLEMSPAPIGLLLSGRVIANIMISTLQVIIMGFIMFTLFNIRFPLRVEALPVLLITLVGVFGFGFIIAGAMLIFKQVESFGNLLNNALAFLNGSFLALSSMPTWLAAIARTLPSTQGIVVIREILLDKKSIATTWRDGSLVGLILHSAVYLIIGLLIFSICERVAKDRGSLGQY